MIGRLFRRTSREDEIFAEAQALIDDGLELPFVLDLYPDDADWLAPLLETGVVIGETFAVEEPSYYFEASLKNRFIEAGIERAHRAATPVQEPVAVVAPAGGGVLRLQGVMASSAVAVVLAGLSIITLGFVTSGNAVPGDWNYSFKLAMERIDYSLASDDARTDITIEHTWERVQEFQKLYERGSVSEQNVQDVRKQFEQLRDLAGEAQLDPVQQANITAAAEAAKAVLTTAKETQPELADEIDETYLVAASVGGGVTGVSAPTPTPTATATTTTATPSATAQPTGTPTATPETEPTDEPATEEPSTTTQPVEGDASPAASPTVAAGVEELP